METFRHPKIALSGIFDGFIFGCWFSDGVVGSRLRWQLRAMLFCVKSIRNKTFYCISTAQIAGKIGKFDDEAALFVIRYDFHSIG